MGGRSRDRSDLYRAVWQTLPHDATEFEEAAQTRSGDEGEDCRPATRGAEDNEETCEERKHRQQLVDGKPGEGHHQGRKCREDGPIRSTLTTLRKAIPRLARITTVKLTVRAQAVSPGKILERLLG